jgi:predicted nucleotidyltransferase
MGILEHAMARAASDPNVVGVVLTGSHARNMATAHSDYDLVVVAIEQAVPWRHEVRSPELDKVVCTVEALADTSVQWQRYAFRGAQILLDRLDGRIADLVERQATPTRDEAIEWARSGLDAYINQLYRAVKSRRDGSPAAAHLDEVESVPWLLSTVFALHGRLRPYNKYLDWELETYPLSPFWTTELQSDRVLANSLRLFPAVANVASEQGHGDILDAWGTDIDLIRAAPACPRDS